MHEALPVGQVVVPRRLHHQGVHGHPGLPDPGRGHGHHGEVPAPAGAPVPSIHRFTERPAHGLPIDHAPREHPTRREQRRMVVPSLLVGPGVLDRLGGQVQPILDRQARQVLEDVLPLGIAFKAEPLAPGLGGLKPPLPVSHFEGGVTDGPRVVVLLGGHDRRAQDVPLSLLIPHRKGSHEVRAGEDHVLVELEGLAVAVRPIAQLRIVDRMRLLPDQQRGDGRGAFAAVGAHHLRPADAFVALSRRRLTSRG